MLGQALEKIFSRAFSSITSLPALFLAGVAVLLSSFVWICLHTLMRSFVGILHYPLLFVISTVATIPLAVSIAPLLMVCLHRRNRREISCTEALSFSWRQMMFMGIISLTASFVEAILGLLIVFWAALSLVPVIGPLVYLISSWIPALLCSAMVIVMAGYVVSLFFFGAAAFHGETFDVESVNEIIASRAKCWVTRIKFCLIALLPLLIVILFSMIQWRIPHYSSYLEFSASIFRVIAFSAITAPAVVFFTHMLLEAEKYIQWLLTHRTK